MTILLTVVASVVWVIPVVLLGPALYYEWKSSRDTVSSLIQVEVMVLLWPMTIIFLSLWIGASESVWWIRGRK